MTSEAPLVIKTLCQSRSELQESERFMFRPDRVTMQPENPVSKNTEKAPAASGLSEKSNFSTFYTQTTSINPTAYCRYQFYPLLVHSSGFSDRAEGQNAAL